MTMGLAEVVPMTLDVYLSHKKYIVTVGGKEP